MRKLFTALCLLATGACTAVDAHEHEGLDYSVFRNFTGTRVADDNKILATQKLGRSLLPGWNATVDNISGGFRDMYGPAATVPGNTNREKAEQFMQRLGAMGINAGQWVNTRDVQVEHAAFVDYKQVVDGREVVFSSLSFRFTPDGRLQRVKTHNYGTPEPGLAPVISAADAMASAAMTSDLAGMQIDTKEIKKDWVWFPVPTRNGYVLHPAWAFEATGYREHEMPFLLKGYIDALTGELLYRVNEVNETFEVTVKGTVFATSPLVPTTEEVMPNIRVSIGSSNYTTDDNGYVIIPSANAPVSVKYTLQGPWAIVRQVPNGNTVPSFTALMLTSGGTYTIPAPDSTTIDFRSVNAMHHASVVHNFMKSHWPSFTGMDNAINTNIDVNGNTCNAFYNNGGFSMNFYAPQPGLGCRAFSEVADIIYHEYGHGISYRFYSAQGSFFQNGAMGEGNSDVWAMAINRDGVVGEGAYYTGRASIRDYTGNPKVYPQDIQGEVHADGEIIAGAWWDVAQNINNIDSMAILFTKTHYDLPNGPGGTEGEIYHDVLVSALMNDDNDANISNGTPHFKEIVEAFARHGIYLLGDARVEHTEVSHQAVNTAVTINAKLTLTNPAFFSQLQLMYRDRYGKQTWDSVVMTNTGGNNYTAQIPGLPAGSIVDYFFKAEDVIAVSAYGLPKGITTIPYLSSEYTLPYQYGVGINYKRYAYDFEGSVDGWTFGEFSDNATEGIWTVEVPIGSFSAGLPIQPGADHTTGSGKCLVTGNATSAAATPGAADVDNGKTTVLSPYFLLNFHEPVVEFYRWYSNDRGSNANLRGDYWSVEMRNQQSIWRKVDYTRESDQQWRRRIFRVNEIINGASYVQFRFIAEDKVVSNQTQNGQNIVEAAVDDFVIYEGSPLAVENMPEHVRAEVYPNPADAAVNVRVPAGSKGSITLYDMTGKTISVQPVTEGNEQYRINTSGLAAGTYLVLVQTQYAIQNTRVSVAHK